jgi:uncharacterized protein YyaL (SSP411 family)
MKPNVSVGPMAGRIAVSLIVMLLLAGSDQPRPGTTNEKSKHPANHLTGQSSPYLLMHLHNPVDWYPWGPEAFAKAKKEGKLIFLSVGYSSCYWCHVMERESFENEEVAKRLNQWFVCVKVDREERPDVDTVYMTALNVTGQRGGWPLSMFLTSDGKPIFGGTYWPAEDKKADGDSIPGFKTILQRVHQLQTDKPKDLERQADKIAALTEKEMAGRLQGIALASLDRTLVDGAVKEILEQFDPEYGGFGSPERHFRGTKFPMPPYLELLLQDGFRTKTKETIQALKVSLDRMARGGIYDQLGGGFHRYSTERTWTVPHFEKMLYDNAQLVEVYAKAYRWFRQPEYRRIVDETLAFVKREMTSPEGGFYSALDAETNSEEGRFYVWTDQEIADALGNGADATFFKKVYGLDGQANFEGRYHILTLHDGSEDEKTSLRLAPLKQKLMEVRSGRLRPFLDTKVLTAWNGQMIAAYATAGQVLENSEYVNTAARAAEFILQNLRNREGRLLRTYAAAPGQAPAAKINAYLDDYAFFIHGLLCLHEASDNPHWLKSARTMTDDMIQYHSDDDRGGFFYTARDEKASFPNWSLGTRVGAKDQYDGVQPSGNSVAARNLVRLWLKTGDARYRELAERTIKAFSANLKANPATMSTMAEALALYLNALDNPPKNPGADTPTDKEKKTKKSEDVVNIAASASKPDADQRQTATISIAIDKSWHLYANPVPADFPGIPTTVTIEAQGKARDATIEYPRGTLVQDKVLGDYYVYEGKVKIQAVVKRTKEDNSSLSAVIKLQACSDKQCLLPSTVKIRLRFDVGE